MQQKKPRTPGSGSARRRGKSAGAQPADVAVASSEQVVAVEDRVATSAGAGEDAVRTRAYYLYLERGSRAGHELDDWLRAEQEMRP
ncbi:MAG TPA: DUF2934 domain-containing protein [Gemmatimonadaceae bacterium]|jgi:hypothetical protein|nr:DUF2934 domain-containing protein [Gemmatimonadaceae bacterium]